MKKMYVIEEAFLGNRGEIIVTVNAITETIENAKSYIEFHSKRNKEEGREQSMWSYEEVWFYNDAIINCFKEYAND